MSDSHIHLLTAIFLGTASVINFIFILFTLFFERKEPSRRYSWLLTLVFLPIVGMFLYIFFSGHFFTKTKRMEAARQSVYGMFKPFLDEQKEFFKDNLSSIQNTAVREYAQLIDMNLAGSNSLVTFTESITIFRFGKDKYEELYRDIESAKKSINLEYFIFRSDCWGSRIMELLCQKAQQGVAVKVLYDDAGSFLTPASFFAPLQKAGGEVLSFFSIRLGALFSLNFRNHRKIAVIDGETAYIGGMNIGDEYANCSKKRKPLFWRDTHVRLTGSSVIALQIVFLTDWYSIASRRHKNVLEDLHRFFPVQDMLTLGSTITADTARRITAQSLEQKHIPTQIVTSGPDDMFKSETRDALIRMIMSAKKYVYIQTPYFTPDEPFATVLKIAAYSGVDIRIMVPGTWDKWYVKAAAFEYIRELLGAGIKFYSYQGFIHSKTAVVDGKAATIGSTNIDNRSFDLHFEVNALFYDKKLAAACEQIFLDDQKKCDEMHSEWFETRFILRRALWSFFRLFSPLF